MNHSNSLPISLLVGTLALTACVPSDNDSNKNETLDDRKNSQESLTFINTVTDNSNGESRTAVSTFKYNNKGYPLSQTDDIHGNGSVLETYEYHYLDNGFLSHISFDEDGDGEQPAVTFIEVTYTDNQIDLDYNLYALPGDRASKISSVIGNLAFQGKTLSSQFSEMDLSGQFKATYALNENDQVESISIFRESNLTADQVTTYSFHENGVVQFESVSVVIAPTAETLSEYRDDGEIISLKTFTNASREFINTETTYTYYPNSTQIFERRIDYSQPPQNPNFTIDTYTYSPDGRIAQRVHSTTSTQGLITWTKVFEDDDAKTGKVLSESKVSHKSGDSNWEDTYTYSENSISRERYNTNSNGNSYRTVWFHDYNEAGQLIEYAFDGVKDGVYDFNHVYEFDEEGYPRSFKKSNDEKASYYNSKTFEFEGNLPLINQISLPIEYENIYEEEVEPS